MLILCNYNVWRRKRRRRAAHHSMNPFHCVSLFCIVLEYRSLFAYITDIDNMESEESRPGSSASNSSSSSVGSGENGVSVSRSRSKSVDSSSSSSRDNSPDPEHNALKRPQSPDNDSRPMSRISNQSDDVSAGGAVLSDLPSDTRILDVECSLFSCGI